MANTSNSFTWVSSGSIVAYFSIAVRFRAVCRFSYDGTPSFQLDMDRDIAK